MYIKKQFLLFISFVFVNTYLFAQPNTNVNLEKDKPKQYENRVLGSEKTDKKKFTLPRRVLQNTYTHYNYYFNANEKLKEILVKAKAEKKDDYTQLLPFYNYTLDATSKSKEDIDSIIYKCTAGILLHDLRNDWVDNLYMVMGKAYLFRKDFDSASGCFQYINYTYSPKEKGGYQILMGSNDSKTNGVFTIATKENKNIIKSLVSKQPSRNESFIWQTRNLLEQDLMGEAAGLIGILKNDPNFPSRLKTDLHEMIAYWFYKQQNYDSAAWHLKKSLDNAEDKLEKARWEFLTAQLYQLAKKDSLAIKMFEKSIKHTTDPLMEIYARLNIVSLATGKKQDALKENLNELLKLAKKEKYEEYRDIIYYAAAQLELKRDGYDNAQNYLLKSVKFSNDNVQQKTQSFIALAELNYNRKKFVEAAAFYDSIQVDNIKNLDEKEKDNIAKRKTALKKIAENYEVIYKEDSLQKIAAMPDSLRNIYVKKISKALKKARGEKDRGEDSGNGVYDTKKADLFASNDSKGEWYFSNNALKSKGFTEFKTRWGRRQNVDNWRRQSAVDKATSTKKTSTVSLDVDDIGSDVKKSGTAKAEETDDKAKGKENEQDISFEGLMSNVPLTTEALAISNKKIQTALFNNGEVFENSLEEWQFAADNFASLLQRYNEFKTKEASLFNLYYCYTKLGLNHQADSVLEILKNKFPTGEKTKIIENKNNKKEATTKEQTATNTYENIYNLYIEGKFEQANAEKQKADSIYGKSYWTPQLLYIEAVYYIKQHKDTLAIQTLNELITLAPNNQLVAKAKNMIEVLKNRKQIEDYLTNLSVERNEDAPEKKVDLTTPETTKTDKTEKKVDDKKKEDVKTVDKKVEVKPVVNNDKKAFAFNASDSQYVMVAFNKVDKVFFNEAKGAFNQFNREKFYNKKINIITTPLNDDYNLLLMGPFENGAKAIEYIDKAKPQAASTIISWIPADKYLFTIISNANLSLLNENKELMKYVDMMKQVLPGKL